MIMAMPAQANRHTPGPLCCRQPVQPSTGLWPYQGSPVGTVGQLLPLRVTVVGKNFQKQKRIWGEAHESSYFQGLGNLPKKGPVGDRYSG